MSPRWPVTRPLFLVDALPACDRAVLAGPEGRHAARVRRIAVGEELDLGDGVGGLARCRVTGTGPDRLVLVVLGRRFVPPGVPELLVVQALAKGARGELAVELLTEAGVDGIVPWAAGRSVPRWRGERGTKALERWRSTARAAAKQSRRAWLPRVEDLHDTVAVAGLLAAAESAFVLHETAELALPDVALHRSGRIVVVVGPEGGLCDDELAVFTAAGGRPARLGQLVLRSSTAGVVAVAVLSARLGRWS